MNISKNKFERRDGNNKNEWLDALVNRLISKKNSY